MPTSLDALDANYLDANRVFVALSKTGAYHETKDLAIVRSGLPTEHFNFAFLKPPLADVVATAAAAQSHFAPSAAAFKLTIRGDQRDCVQPLEASGWRRKDDPTPGMTLAVPGSIPAAPKGLGVREVLSHDDLVAFREAAFRGFGFPVAAAHVFLNERLLRLPHVRLYSGVVGGAVVATSMLVATGTVAGIYWVATEPEQRRRGYGEALTWAAVGGGRELGCAVASLQASNAGRPVYARMGFEHVLDYESLHPPEAPA
jgi:hypothetical protein